MKLAFIWATIHQKLDDDHWNSKFVLWSAWKVKFFQSKLLLRNLIWNLKGDWFLISGWMWCHLAGCSFLYVSFLVVGVILQILVTERYYLKRPLRKRWMYDTVEPHKQEDRKIRSYSWLFGKIHRKSRTKTDWFLSKVLWDGTAC